MTPREGLPKSAPIGMVGRELDHYVLQEELGQGGMSVVYRARDSVLQRDVAIKVLHPFLADRADARRRLAREARAVAKLRHTNILEVYGFSGEEAPQGYISMELVRGETLKQFGERDRIYPCEVGAAIAWVVAGALQHAHDSGVIHRDVKPENVMIRQDGVLKLMDFGIAHVVDAAHLTITGTLQGSPAHMAPEVIEGGEVDVRADLFSLGTVLFWLATGQLPFTAKTPHALLKKIVEGRYTEPQRLNPEVSDRLAGVIKKSLAREPADRYPSANELRLALQAVWEEGGLEDPAVSLPQFFKQPQKHRTEWGERAATRFIAIAETQLKTGDRVKALSAVNRVLALRPDHPGASGLMKGIERKSRAAGRFRIGLGIACILALATTAVGVAQMVDERATADQPPPAVVHTVVAPPPPEVPAAPERAISRRRPTVARSQVPPREKPVVAQPATSTAISAPPATPAVLSGPAQSVTVRVDPWGDLEVDGEIRGRGQKLYTVQLSPGRHRLRFLHTYAQTVEREVDVTAERAPEVSVQLHKAKPAFLVIRSADDPDVLIDGDYKGPANDTEKAPILIPLPDLHWQRAITVALHKEGKQSVEFERTVVAGEKLELPVRMREADPEPREVLPVAEEEPVTSEQAEEDTANP